MDTYYFSIDSDSKATLLGTQLPEGVESKIIDIEADSVFEANHLMILILSSEEINREKFTLVDGSVLEVSSNSEKVLYGEMAGHFTEKGEQEIVYWV